MKTKVMSRAFSQSPKDAKFQRKFSDAIAEASEKGSSTLKEEGEDLELTKTDEGIEIKDNLNDETTVATENPEDANDVVLEAKTVANCRGEAPVEKEIVKVTEEVPGESYSIKTKEQTFSVKGSFQQAYKVARSFSEYVEVDLKPEGTNMEPENTTTIDRGVEDKDKNGLTGDKNFTDQVCEACKNAEEDPEGSILEVENTTTGAFSMYHIKKESKGFSVKKLDSNTHIYSSVPEDDIVAKVVGNVAEPEAEVAHDEGVTDPSKTSTDGPDLAEALEKVESELEEGDNVILHDETEAVAVEKKDGKFSYYRIDVKNRTFSETTKEELLAGEPAKPETLEDGIDALEAKAEEVSSEPTKDNAQELKKNVEEVTEQVEKAECYSATKKKSLLARLKVFSEIAEEAIAATETGEGNEAPVENKEETHTESTITEEQARSFSSVLESGKTTRVFAKKEEVDKASQRVFSATSGAGETANPFLMTKF